MSRCHLALFAVLLGSPAWGQSTNEVEARSALEKLLDEPLLDAKELPKDVPLTQFLAAVEKLLPKDKRVALRLEREAFGEEAGAIAATPVAVAAPSGKLSLRRALESALAKIKGKVDYRLELGAVVITTPRRARYQAEHDIRFLVERPQALVALRPAQAPLGNEPASKAEVVQALATLVDGLVEPSAPADAPAIQVLNGTRLSILANASRHAQVTDLLQSLRRLNDVSVFAKAHLYEVDADFAQRLKNAKRVSLEEAERQFLAGGVAKDDLWKLLEKQKSVQAGDLVWARDELETTLLSRHQVIACLPTPDQVFKGEKGPRTILEGVSFLGMFHVSADRRSVQVKLTEKATEIQELRKVKAWSVDGQEAAACKPFLKETAQSQVLEIPDGGSVIFPVHIRPKPIRDKDRYWALSITVRIHIEEEEHLVLTQGLEEIAPQLVAEVLKNPRLRVLRNFYGSPDDPRFTLVNGDAWSWPEKLRPDVPGFQLTHAEKKGKRLLGIRLDKLEESGKDNTDRTVTLALLNAGGDDNGPAVGSCTLRYRARQSDKGWTVELAEEP